MAFLLALGLGFWINSRPAEPSIAGSGSPMEETAVPAVPGDKSGEEAETQRAKPDAVAVAPGAALPADDRLPVSSGSEDFAVIDSAGYSTNLESYRGSVLLFGVWSSEHPEAAANLQKVYLTFGANDKLRVLGVAAQRQERPDGFTFPVVFNHGSRLLDVPEGEYMLVDAAGKPVFRGSLVGPSDSVQSQLKSQLGRLGVQ